MELPSHVDPAYIARVLRTLCAEGDVIEARVLGVPRAGHISGYFRRFGPAGFRRRSLRWSSRGAYFTLNPVQPSLLARGDQSPRRVGQAHDKRCGHPVSPLDAD